MNEFDRRDCEYYGEYSICQVLGCKCKEVDDWDCPVECEYYEPYLAGDCEEF